VETSNLNIDRWASWIIKRHENRALGCQMKISIKSQTVLIKARKRPNRLFSCQKKAKLCLWYSYSFVTKNLNYKISLETFFEFWIKCCLAQHLMLLWLCMFCEIVHFGYNGATVCILIHRQLSARKSPIHSYTYDQNHKSPSAFWTSLSRFYRGDASVEVAYNACLVLTTHNTVHTFPMTTQNIISNLAFF